MEAVLLFIFKLSIILFFIPVAVYSLFVRLKFKGEYIFAVSMGFSPALLSWFYMLLLRISPGHSSTFYLLLTTLPFVLCSLQPTMVIKFINEFRIFKPIFQEKLYLAIIVFFLIFIILNYLNMPLMGNDPLEYFYLSHLIDVKKDVSFYPNVVGIEPRGALFPFSHPIGYPTLLAWAKLGFHEEGGLFMGKIFSIVFLFLTLFVATSVQIKENLRPYLLFSLIFLGIPLVFSNVLEAHIDSVRMLLYLLSFLALYDFLKNQGSLFIVGIGCGLSWFFHSLGLLTLIMILASFGFFRLLQDRKISLVNLWKITCKSLIIILICILFVFLDLLNIYSVHKNIIGDLNNVQIIKYLSSEYEHYDRISRELGLTIDERFLKLLKLHFIDLFLFGFSYWLALIGIVIGYKSFLNNLKENKWNYIDFSFVVVVLSFSLFVIFTLVGIDKFTYNCRYTMQILPFVCFLGTLALKRWLA